ncbi:hypothetical protein [uncultured Shewanella sp.]|uniref:DUF3472 domain-containing protein n=1 Tax=uncultured Shewanella sp. TaxID=173975 RepID=UPI002607DD50|nr:hypothetical protein [uncultured Shewanella sp.]
MNFFKQTMIGIISLQFSLIVPALAQVDMISCDTFSEKQPTTPALGQRYNDISPLYIGTDNETGNELYYWAQQTPDSILQLGVNELFHDYKDGVKLAGNGAVDLPGLDEFNKGESFTYIENWSDIDNTLIWPLFLENTGSFTLTVQMGVDASQAGSQILFTLGEQQALCTTPSTDGEDQPRFIWSIPFNVTQTGYLPLEISIDKLIGTSVGRFYTIEAQGEGAHNAYVLRARWRPSAVHASFETSLNTNPKRLWVVEISPSHYENYFYAPINTQFGYFGSGRHRGGEVAGLNFSMWSYGKDETEPTVDMLSHLIALGNKQATYGGFSHEGTGVKLEDWMPYDGYNIDKQILALRMEPGDPYDTYYGYFLHPDTQHWQLYAAGKKYNYGVPNSSITAGSFIEVVGNSSVNRTGIKEREVSYRGWYMDNQGQWAAMDTMSFNDKAGEYMNKSWSVSDDKMQMRMGGMAHHLGTQGRSTLTTNVIAPLPNYLQGGYIDELYALPAIISQLEALNISGSQAEIQFNIDKLGDNATVLLYWGETQGLTFSERWQNVVEIDAVQSGSIRYSLQNLTPDTAYFYRIYIENDAGKTWSFDTETFNTDK